MNSVVMCLVIFQNAHYLLSQRDAGETAAVTLLARGRSVPSDTGRDNKSNRRSPLGQETEKEQAQGMQ